MDEDDVAKQPPRRAPVARRGRVKPEVWEKAIADYLGGATATEVARRYGVARQSIYSRLSGKGKKARWRAALLPLDGGAVGAHAPTEGVAGAGDSGRASGGASGEVEAPPSPAVRLRSRASADVHLPHRGGGGEAAAPVTETARRIRIRRHHAQEIWLQARADYEVGHHTARAIAENYGMTEDAIRRRARVERWSKLIRVAPPPLLAPPPADEVERVDGETVSAWEKIAHGAQRYEALRTPAM